MCVDLFSAECIFAGSKQAKSEQVAEYFAHIAEYYQKKGMTKLVIFFDQNPTHKNKMKGIFKEATKHLEIKTQFRFLPAYSPKLNLVEYVIHLIRLAVLHHADCKTSLKEFETRIQQICNDPTFITQEKIVNILAHIESLVPKF